jgi:hypothetical protein
VDAIQTLAVGALAAEDQACFGHRVLQQGEASQKGVDAFALDQACQAAFNRQGAR